MNIKRFHPLRISAAIRETQAEIRLSPNEFIAPYFLVEGHAIQREIPGLRSIHHYSIDRFLQEVSTLVNLGINKVLLFGVVDPDVKDAGARYAYSPSGLIQRAVRTIRENFPQLCIFTDVCLCGYTDHGHCGLLEGAEIDNDKTLEVLSRIAVSHAQAGADFVCPSSMMDGQVWAIRKGLDEAGYQQTRILSYSAKYASAMYGPFREAARSAPSFGDRKSYQMDYRTQQQGIEECIADDEEGADYLMVKPAHTYLDMIRQIRDRFPGKPLAAYHVSGEYMMVKLAAESGLADEWEAMMEVHTAIKRAGADLIISYWAKTFAASFTGKAASSIILKH